MGKLIFGMMQSLDGYVDDTEGTLVMPVPDPVLFRHFTDVVSGAAGCLYGRSIYELMRYWDGDETDWGPAEREFAAAWQSKPKWVFSRTLKEVGPNATLVSEDLAGFVRHLKATIEGYIDVAGPQMAGSLTELGLIDEYRLYFRPFVLGSGKPYFAGARPPLQLVDVERIGEEAVKLTYVPA